VNKYMSMQNIRPNRWAKVSEEGIKIPLRCPDCKSTKTVLATYAFVECEGCYQVIKEINQCY